MQPMPVGFMQSCSRGAMPSRVPKDQSATPALSTRAPPSLHQGSAGVSPEPEGKKHASVFLRKNTGSQISHACWRCIHQGSGSLHTPRRTTTCPTVCIKQIDKVWPLPWRALEAYPTSPLVAPDQPYSPAMGMRATLMFTCAAQSGEASCHLAAGQNSDCYAAVAGACPGRTRQWLWVSDQFRVRALSMLHSTNAAEVAATSNQRCGMPNTLDSAATVSALGAPSDFCAGGSTDAAAATRLRRTRPRCSSGDARAAAVRGAAASRPPRQ